MYVCAFTHESLFPSYNAHMNVTCDGVEERESSPMKSIAKIAPPAKPPTLVPIAY